MLYIPSLTIEAISNQRLDELENLDREYMKDMQALQHEIEMRRERWGHERDLINTCYEYEMTHSNDVTRAAT